MQTSYCQGDLLLTTWLAGDALAENLFALYLVLRINNLVSSFPIVDALQHFLGACSHCVVLVVCTTWCLTPKTPSREVRTAVSIYLLTMSRTICLVRSCASLTQCRVNSVTPWPGVSQVAGLYRSEKIKHGILLIARQLANMIKSSSVACRC